MRSQFIRISILLRCCRERTCPLASCSFRSSCGSSTQMSSSSTSCSCWAS
ncbi:unnamed protein product [Polarella glacialis]|uniref:Uncharacterized protein n=1 Tax=Polarella glacialis TaxID=89957 RepID=A0A813HA03_POLGL|nr:unnamed protein product [Polarella glacialis]